MKYTINSKQLFIVFVFLYSLGVQAQSPQKIWGRVVDAFDQPIENALVIADATTTADTNRNGIFVLNYSDAFPLTLNIQMDGYNGNYLTITENQYDITQGLHIQLSSTNKGLDEILITVRRNNSYLTNNIALGGKFSGTLKELPQSVAVVTAEFMEDKQAYTTRDVIQDLAGVTEASSYDEVVIRGYKSGYNSGVRLVNGMRSSYGVGNSYYRSPLTLNLESIEVLKGPGASLFGDVAPGGTINMVTKKPLSKSKNSIQFTAGSFETLRTNVDLGGPLDKDKKILYRLNAGYEYTSTFRDNNEQRNFMLAPSFTFLPTDGTKIDVDLVYDQFNGYLDRGMGIKANDFYAMPRSFTLSQPSDFFRNKTISFSTRLNQRITDNVSLNLGYMKSIYQEDVNEHRTLNTYADAPTNTIMNMRFFDRHGKDFTDNVVGYVKWDLIGHNFDNHIVAGVDYSQYHGGENNNQREARSKTIDGKIVPLTFDLNNPVYAIQDISNYVWRTQGAYPFLNPYKTTGIYIQDQMTIADRLQLILGLRREFYDSKTYENNITYQANQNAWLPRLGLTYKVNSQINYFASYSQGFVPVGANFIQNYQDYGAEKPFKAERSYQIETGLKTGFFDNQLQVDMSLFQIQRQNMMISTGTVSEAGFPMYRQSGEAVSKGIELDVRGQLSKEFQIMANYTFNKTSVKSSSIDSEVGQSLPGAPKNMASLWMKYVFSDTQLKGLGFGAGMNYVDVRRMDNSIGNNAAGEAMWGYWPSYTTVNAAVYYHVGNMKLALNANNLFDTYYFLGGFDYTRAFPGTPRNIMLSLGYNF